MQCVYIHIAFCWDLNRFLQQSMAMDRKFTIFKKKHNGIVHCERNREKLHEIAVKVA